MKKVLIGLTALLMSCTKTYNAHEAKLGLAQCLVREEATMYGTDWCGWCNKQKEEFGEEAWNAFRKRYVDCSETGSEEDQAKCMKDNVNSYPYWRFKNGKDAQGYLSLENLAKISGCDN